MAGLEGENSAGKMTSEKQYRSAEKYFEVFEKLYRTTKKGTGMTPSLVTVFIKTRVS